MTPPDIDAGYINVSVAIVGALLAILGIVFIVANGYWLIAGVPLEATGLLLLAAELSA